MNKIFKALALVVLAASLCACEKFLDRPSEDNYNVGNFYKTDAQCEQGVNYLYNSPWYDVIRPYIKIGEVFSGNLYMGSSPYLDFTVNASDADLMSMSQALWAVNAHCNTVMDNIHRSEGPSQAGKNKTIGEALVWKAMTYFFLVRAFGEVPIIHNNLELITTGQVNTVKKALREDVYDYIIMNLKKAMSLLPKKTSGWANYERIDYYAAEALLAKVYLTKAGISGQLNTEDLENAAKYAKDVIDNSGRTLMDNYADVFRLSGFNQTGECLISWLWVGNSGVWTAQNSLQSDLGMTGFSENGYIWGDWNGISVDLQEAFGTSAIEDPAIRSANEGDTRRKATMMLVGDKYDYFWSDKGGFDYLKFAFDSEYNPNGDGTFHSGTGSNVVKHMYGDNADHTAALGYPAERMAYTLPTHLLRLSDVYLIYAEASLLTGDQSAADTYVGKVRGRAHAKALDHSVTFEDIWKERRLELALEGDRWYDYVRRSYYDAPACIAEIKAQHRSTYDGISDVYKKYYEDGTFSLALDAGGEAKYNGLYDNPNITVASFSLPIPTDDVIFNKNLGSDVEAEHVDVSQFTYPF